MDKKTKRIVFIVVELILIFLIINNIINIGGVDGIILSVVLFLFMLLFYYFFNENKVYNIFGKSIMSKKLNDSIENDIDYFREIINKYSIGELAFLEGYDIDYPKDIIAIILKLKLIKIIDIIDNKIVIVGKDDNLRESEKYIIDSIRDGKIVLEEDLTLKEMIKKELVNDKLLLKEERNLSVLEKVFKFGIIGFVIFLICFMCISKVDLSPDMEENVMTIVAIVFFIICFVMIIVNIIKSVWHNFSIKLTEEGKEIKSRLNGLKKYLEHFSVIDKRKIEELFLYEDYLIYSVMFNINKDIIDKYRELVIVDEELYVEIK